MWFYMWTHKPKRKQSLLARIGPDLWLYVHVFPLSTLHWTQRKYNHYELAVTSHCVVEISLNVIICSLTQAARCCPRCWCLFRKCFLRLELLLVAIAVSPTDCHAAPRVILNPSGRGQHATIIGPEMKGFFICQSEDEAKRVAYYCNNCHDNGVAISKCDCFRRCKPRVVFYLKLWLCVYGHITKKTTILEHAAPLRRTDFLVPPPPTI